MYYLIILAVMEIAFAVWAFCNKLAKKKFYIGRIALRCIELIGVILAMAITHDSVGMRNKPVLAVIIIMLIFAIVRWLITRKRIESCQNDEKQKKASERKSAAGRIIKGILVICLFAIALIPAFLFANYRGLPTSGPYEVKMTDTIWIDENRVEAFETDGSYREVPVHFYYPDTDSNEEYPLIIFSHGAFGYYQSNTSTYCELASKGYVVVSLDHPYHSFFTKDTSGKIITVNTAFMNDVMIVNGNDVPEELIYEKSSEWMALRNADITFVIEYIKGIKRGDTETADDIIAILSMADDTNIGLIGHSLGGAASVAVGRTCDDVKAVIDLDGTMLGEQVYIDGHYDINNDPYPVPLLVISNDEHHNSMEETGLLYVNNVVLENAIDAREIYFKNSGHMNFTDLPLFSPALSSMLGIGTIDSTDCIVQMNEVVDNFFDYYLKGEGELNIQECYE